MTANKKPNNVICAFYAAVSLGSEYRAGFEFIKFAASKGFELAVIADLEENSSVEELEASAPGIRVVRLPSPIKQQAKLYRYTDFLPQIIWHHRVARWLRKQPISINSLWLQNGAQPWLPVVPYFGLSKILIWGPVGGGETPTPAMMDLLPRSVRCREFLRATVERFMLGLKFSAILKHGASNIVTIARTQVAQQQLERGLGRPVPLIPEILDIFDSVHIERLPVSSPRFIWVGQDIPRKNLTLALQIFKRLKDNEFSNATLDVYGCTSPQKFNIANVTFHGWTRNIPWRQYRDDGVLILTSFREGLPSVVLEAARNGLLSISSDVGAIGSLPIPTIFVLPCAEYPEYSGNTFDEILLRIKRHLSQSTIRFGPVSNREKLTEYLCAAGVIK